MRLPGILPRYVAREVLIYTLLGMVAVSVVFIGQNLLRYLDRFLMIGATSGDFLTVLRCVAVIIIAYTLPIAFLFGVLVAIGRMASDVEIVAMRACGIGLARLVLPVFVLGLLVSCITWYIALEVEHRAKRELRDALLAMTASGTMIEAGRFTMLEDRLLYVRSRDRENRLEGILISDQSNAERPVVIFAERGTFGWDPDTGIAHFRLEDGDVHVDGSNGSGEYYRMAFEVFEYAFEVNKLLKWRFEAVRPKDMTMEELRGLVRHARGGGSLDHMLKKTVQHYEVQIHRRYALPVAPMLFALTAVPLSLRRARGARSWGALLCGLIVTVYYGLLTFSQYLAMEGRVPVAPAMWLPNAAFGLIAAALLWRARRFG